MATMGPHLFVNDDGTVGHCARLDPCEQCESGEPPTSVEQAKRESDQRVAAQNAADWARWIAKQRG